MSRAVRSLAVPPALALALLAGATACRVTAPGAPAPPGALIVTQVPATAEPAPPAARLDPDRRYPQGSRVVLMLAPPDARALRVLSRGLPQAGGPALSFDGRRVTFAGRRTARLGWTLFEAGIDGRRPVQILRGELDCIDPAYLEDHRLVFTCSARRPGPRTWALHTATDGGRELTRITFGPGSAFDPTPLDDGRILFVMEQGAGPGRDAGGAGLFTINPDGTMLAPFTGSHDGQRWKARPRRTADGGVIFLAGDAPDAARLERVEMGRPLTSRRDVRADEVLAAEPLPDTGLLLAGRRLGAAPSPAALFRAAAAGDEPTEILRDPAFHLVEALPVVAGGAPPRRPSPVDATAHTGTLVCYDAGRSDGVHAPRAGRPTRVTAEMMSPTGGTEGAVVPLGAVPLAEDGSFHIQVPADRPLRLVREDSAGGVSRSSWFWVRPGEVRSCFGCHENRESAPPNRVVRALAAPAEVLPATPRLAQGERP